MQWGQVSIEKKVLDELLNATGAKTKSAAVKKIIDEYLRERKVDNIMSMKGKRTLTLRRMKSVTMSCAVRSLTRLQGRSTRGTISPG